MIRIILIIAILAAALYLIRWFLTTPAETVAAQIRKSLWLFLGLGLIFLGITGRLNMVFALLGGAIPWITRHLPSALRLLGFAKTIKDARDKTTSQKDNNIVTKTSMGIQQAYKVLGIIEGATRSEIITAHKRLAQKIHPDKGGSEHLTQEINYARDVLLKAVK